MRSSLHFLLISPTSVASSLCSITLCLHVDELYLENRLQRPPLSIYLFHLSLFPWRKHLLVKALLQKQFGWPCFNKEWFDEIVFISIAATAGLRQENMLNPLQGCREDIAFVFSQQPRADSFTKDCTSKLPELLQPFLKSFLLIIIQYDNRVDKYPCISLRQVIMAISQRALLC